MALVGVLLSACQTTDQTDHLYETGGISVSKQADGPTVPPENLTPIPRSAMDKEDTGIKYVPAPSTIRTVPGSATDLEHWE